MRVGNPESPGFFQYVCHSGAMRSWNPTVIGLPGCAAVRSARSCASTCSVFTAGAANAEIEIAMAARALRCFICISVGSFLDHWITVGSFLDHALAQGLPHHL